MQTIASSERSESEKILLQQVGAEIASRLRQSLHNQVFINIEKEEQPKQVKRPWDYEVKVGSKTNEKLSEDTTILEVFDSPDIQGRLLILCKPGSGKTTTMLDLAKKLLEKSQNATEPIPILVNLSSWASKQQSIPEWLVEELHTKYVVNPKIGKQWLQENKLLPLLDGLDEVKSSCQQDCIDALNQWIRGNAEVTSPRQLLIKDLKEERERLKREERRKRFKKPERRLIKEQRKKLNQRIERLGCYSSRQMRLWLVWLAKQMELEQQTEFLVEKIQPGWLRSRKLYELYRWEVELRIGLIEWPILGLGLGLLGVVEGGLGVGGLIIKDSGTPERGLGVFIKHFVLRQLLYANGFAPWNYARFLVSCSDCLLLQRVGGRFRFIHKTVQEHFAAMPFEKP